MPLQGTSKPPEPEAALAEWRRVNRPAGSARKILPAISAPDNLIQMRLPMLGGGKVANAR